jgi:4-diphosphocytidyl-2-C-methyl-D-erythritol kinase
VPERSVHVRAHAKLNLSLKVLYKRPDNFHEIRTIFQTISLADRLSITYRPARATRIALNGSPEIPDNLVERAARRCLDEMRLTADLNFSLKKNIPMGAGLGGGSSDAAAVLLALPALTGCPIPIGRLHSIAAELGSDVPFFLYGGTALGLGKGDELYPLPSLKSQPGVLVAPDIHVSTPEAYGALSASLSSHAAKLEAFQSGAWSTVGFVPENDFEAAVFPRHPALRRLKRRLAALGAQPALMTGSGSAIFGLFNSKETVASVVQSLRRERVFSIQLLSGAGYRREWFRRLQPHIKGDIWPPRSRYAQ